MIKAQELRIGNIVTIRNPISWPLLLGNPMIVTGISECLGMDDELTHTIGLKKIKPGHSVYSQFLKFIEPIPLTEDWLIRFGFKKETAWFRFEKHAINLKIAGLYEFKNIPIREICYVHQLQNLYFALTGTEIELKSK